MSIFYKGTTRAVHDENGCSNGYLYTSDSSKVTCGRCLRVRNDDKNEEEEKVKLPEGIYAKERRPGPPRISKRPESEKRVTIGLDSVKMIKPKETKTIKTRATFPFKPDILVLSTIVAECVLINSITINDKNQGIPRGTRGSKFSPVTPMSKQCYDYDVIKEGDDISIEFFNKSDKSFRFTAALFGYPLVPVEASITYHKI